MNTTVLKVGTKRIAANDKTEKSKVKLKVEKQVEKSGNGSKPKVVRDYTKYEFENRIYGKGQLVHAVISSYIKKNPKTTYGELNRLFPRELQGSFDVVVKVKDAIPNRYHLHTYQILRTADARIAITREWGLINTERFIEHAKDLGFDIKPVS